MGELKAAAVCCISHTEWLNAVCSQTSSSGALSLLLLRVHFDQPYT